MDRIRHASFVRRARRFASRSSPVAHCGRSRRRPRRSFPYRSRIAVDARSTREERARAHGHSERHRDDADEERGEDDDDADGVDATTGADDRGVADASRTRRGRGDVSRRRRRRRSVVFVIVVIVVVIVIVVDDDGVRRHTIVGIHRKRRAAAAVLTKPSSRVSRVSRVSRRRQPHHVPQTYFTHSRPRHASRRACLCAHVRRTARRARARPRARAPEHRRRAAFDIVARHAFEAQATAPDAIVVVVVVGGGRDDTVVVVVVVVIYAIIAVSPSRHRARGIQCRRRRRLMTRAPSHWATSTVTRLARRARDVRARARDRETTHEMCAFARARPRASIEVAGVGGGGDDAAMARSVGVTSWRRASRVMPSDDDDGFVLNIADDDDDDGARRRKVGNPRRRTVARGSKKGYRGGAKATQRREDGGGGGGGASNRDDDDSRRHRRDASVLASRGGGYEKNSARARSGVTSGANAPTRGGGTRPGGDDRDAAFGKRRRGVGGPPPRTKKHRGDDAFEVVKNDNDDDDEDGGGGGEAALTFNPRDWASLMKSAAAQDVGSSARGDVDGEGENDDATHASNRARVFGREAKTFEECGLPPSMVKHLTENVGFGAPTTVQARTIPRLLAGRDVMVRAETGSGKTLSYIAPLFSEIGGITPRVTREGGTRGLILVPTRELATQVEDTARVVGRPYHWVVTSSIMGGENRTKEKARLRKGVVLLIATPGRLLDHLRMTESFNVDNLRWLVLDEADRLLDLGFEEDLNAILGEISRRTENASLCTALLSATLTPGTARLAERMVDPVTIVIEPEKDDLEIVGGGGSDSDADGGGGHGTMDIDGLKRMANIMAGGSKIRMPEGLNHTSVEVSMKARLPALAGLLAGWMQGSISKAIVFFSSCESVEYHYKTLRWLAKGSKGKMEDDDDAAQGPYEIFRLHGMLAQGERTSVFRKFAETKSGVLLCTDVGARGLDFVGVGATVQVDPPNDATTYVHRVGRTARLGSNGEAVLFLQPKEHEFKEILAREGVKFKEGSAVAMLNVLDEAKSASDRDRSMFKSMPHLHPAAQYMTKKLMSKVASDKPYNTLAKDAFRAYVRAYATFPSAVKHIFHIKRLHLGHVAAAFGLKDPPQLIGSSATKAALKAQKDAARKKLKSDGRKKKDARDAKKAKKLAPRGASFAPIGM